jgi:hypothetical protein
MKEKAMQNTSTTRFVRLGAVLAVSAALAIAAQAQAPSQTQGGMMDDPMPGTMQDGGMMEDTMPGTMQDGRMMEDGMPGMMRRRGMMMRGMMHGGGMMGRQGHCPMGGGSAAHTEGRLAFLKAGLAIAGEQNGAWEAYASAFKKSLEAFKGVHDTMLMAVAQAKSPASRLDARIAALEAKAATLKELKPALTGLYAALSDEQKMKANELLAGMGCMM